MYSAAAAAACMHRNILNRGEREREWEYSLRARGSRDENKGVREEEALL